MTSARAHARNRRNGDANRAVPFTNSLTTITAELQPQQSKLVFLTNAEIATPPLSFNSTKKLEKNKPLENEIYPYMTFVIVECKSLEAFQRGKYEILGLRNWIKLFFFSRSDARTAVRIEKTHHHRIRDYFHPAAYCNIVFAYIRIRRVFPFSRGYFIFISSA